MAKKSRELAKRAAYSACRHKIVESQGRRKTTNGEKKVAEMHDERKAPTTPPNSAKVKLTPMENAAMSANVQRAERRKRKMDRIAPMTKGLGNR